MKGTIRLRARHSAIKWYVVARVQLYREDNEGNVVTTEPYFRNITYRTLTPTELKNHHLNEAFQKVMAGLEKIHSRVFRMDCESSKTSPSTHSGLYTISCL